MYMGRLFQMSVGVQPYYRTASAISDYIFFVSGLHFSFIIIFLKMTSSDKDFRFMATNDLMAELQKDSIKLDDDSERKVSSLNGMCNLNFYFIH